MGVHSVLASKYTPPAQERLFWMMALFIDEENFFPASEYRHIMESEL